MTTPKERFTDEAVAAAVAERDAAHAESVAKMANELQKLRAELTAARTVAEGEVANYTIRVHTIANHALDPGPARTDLHHAADLLTRLSAAKAEAERNASDAHAISREQEDSVIAANFEVSALEERIATAERERDEARAALREHVVHQSVRLAHGGGVVPNGHYCGICRAECDPGEELVHEPTCILAALTPTQESETP